MLSVHETEVIPALSASMLSTRGVITNAGDTALTSIPSSPYAFERLLVRLMSAALEAL